MYINFVLHSVCILSPPISDNRIAVLLFAQRPRDQYDYAEKMLQDHKICILQLVIAQ